MKTCQFHKFAKLNSIDHKLGEVIFTAKNITSNVKKPPFLPLLL